MTDLNRSRCALLMALTGSLVIVLHLSAAFWGQRLGASLPVFEKSAPAVPGWPSHISLPIG